MLSEMSTNDLATYGYTLGFGETLDNPRSTMWNAGATTSSGNGLSNNRPFLPNATVDGNRFKGHQVMYKLLKVKILLMIAFHLEHHNLLMYHKWDLIIFMVLV